MWNCPYLIVLAMVVLSSTEKSDTINNLLSEVKIEIEKLDNLQCLETGFIHKKLVNPKLPTMDQLEPAQFNINKSCNVELEFTFKYANRNTSLVTIKPNGVLFLRHSIGDTDLIAPIPQGNPAPDDKSTVTYRKTAEYFLVKWNDLAINENASIKAMYTVAVIIYETGEIIIAYDKINDLRNDPIQIVKYHKTTDLNQYAYFGPWLNLTEIATGTIVYVEECSPEKVEPNRFENKLGTNLNEAKPMLEPAVEHNPPVVPPIPLKTVDHNKSPAKITTTPGLTPKIIPNYGEADTQSNALFDTIDMESSAEIPVAGKTIDFNFKFNNFLFETVTIERKGKILLNGKSQISPQVQVEPIPQTKEVGMESLDMKYRIHEEELTILLYNLKIKTKAAPSDTNENLGRILLVLKKAGTIKIVYANLTNTDIDGNIVFLYTNGNVTEFEGEVEFTKIKNGTSVLFSDTTGPAPIPAVIATDTEYDDKVTLFDIVNKFNATAFQFVKNDSLLEQYYEIDLDDIASTYEKDIATVISKFTIQFNGRSFQNVYITKQMELYFDTVEQKLQIVPDADKFSNIEFKYSTTSDYIALTWVNLQTINAAIIYNLRVLIFRTDQILILFKEIKSDKQISHQFIQQAAMSELVSGSIVHIPTNQITKIPIIIAKSMQQLKDEVTSKLDDKLNPSLIFTGLEVELVEQFDRATLNLKSIDFNNTKSGPINLGLEICAAKVVHVSSAMQLYIDESKQIKLVPDANNLLDSSFKLINHTEFVAMKWDNLKINKIEYNLRVFIYPDGDVLVLYKKIGPTSIANEFMHTTKPIELEDGRIVKINMCNIIPLLFNDLLSEFASIPDNSCANPVVATIDDTKLQKYLSLSPDSDEVIESKSIRTIPSKFKILYEHEMELETIFVELSVLLYWRDDAKISIIPTNYLSIVGVDFKSTTTNSYISLTWRNLTVKTDESTIITYKQIRAIIFQTGTILIVYDIQQTVPNEFLPTTNSIDLKHGVIVKIENCTLLENSVVSHPPKSFADLAAEFHDPTTNVLQLAVADFNHYFTMSSDNTSASCSNNVCTVESKFKIRYGDSSEVTTIRLANTTQLYFVEEQDALNLVGTDVIVESITNQGFNYTATDDYVSISWRNLTTSANKTCDIRMVIFVKGYVIVLYHFTNNGPGSTINDLLRLKNMTTNQSIVKITINEIYDHFRPNALLAEVKGTFADTTDLCATQVNDTTKTIITKLFAIKVESTLPEDQLKILLKRTFYDFTIIDEDSLNINYMITPEYIRSISITNVTLSNGTDFKMTLDVFTVYYPTGEIIFGYKNIKGTARLNILVQDTPMDITNGTVVYVPPQPCKKPNGVEQKIDDTLNDEALTSDYTSTANQNVFSHLAGLVFGVSLTLMYVNYL